MPQSPKVFMIHKVMIINCLKLVIFCFFVPLWLNYAFREESDNGNSKNI